MSFHIDCLKSFRFFAFCLFDFYQQWSLYDNLKNDVFSLIKLIIFLFLAFCNLFEKFNLIAY